MIALPDVNLLIALFDPVHVHHEAAHAWFAGQRALGWATCPLTENGMVRILSNPSYPGRRTTLSDALDRLRIFREAGRHSFWPDAVSLCEKGLIATAHLSGHRQVTDVYLLALAVRNDGSLATFDRGISLGSVPSASSRNLIAIG